MDDLEIGLPFPHSLRQPNKKMKKRKQLDALLKFRPSSTSKIPKSYNRLTTDVLLTSEDELFLPNQTPIQKKSYSSPCRRWCNYTRHILSFCFVCIFMIVCVGLAYANIELKNEVQNLSARVSEIEKRFSTSEMTRVLSTIEQIQIRLNLIERWNVSFLYDRFQRLQKDFHSTKKDKDRLHIGSTEMSMNDEDISFRLDHIEQKSKDFADVANELEKLSRDADEKATDVISRQNKPLDRTQLAHFLEEEERRSNSQQDSTKISQNLLVLNESLSAYVNRWENQLNGIRADLTQMSNKTFQIQEFTHRFEFLNNLIENSSNATSSIITNLQSTLTDLRTQIDNCKCPKEPIHLKPSVVEGEHLQQSIVTKPNGFQSSKSTTIFTENLDQNKTVESKTNDDDDDASTG